MILGFYVQHEPKEEHCSVCGITLKMDEIAYNTEGMPYCRDCFEEWGIGEVDIVNGKLVN